ncbi:MAG: hypothetical protein JW914_02790 [Syntrophaceae bacterium]|nr:hypothetical protein [Syntrophaceae bacterium]
MLIILHLSFMSGAALCLIIGVAMAIFWRSKNYWLKAHKTFNTTGFIMLILGAAMAIASVITGGGEHFAGRHQQIGLAALIFSCFTVFLGYYSFYAGNKKAVMAAHRWLGRLSLACILFTLTLGLIMIGIV